MLGRLKKPLRQFAGGLMIHIEVYRAKLHDAQMKLSGITANFIRAVQCLDSSGLFLGGLHRYAGRMPRVAQCYLFGPSLNVT